MNVPPDRLRVTVGYDYVLIIEWLNPDDRRTGAELHARLLAARVETRLCVCTRAEEVRTALDSALQEVGARGVPATHLETHGTDPFKGDAVDIGFSAGCERIRWSEFGEWLAPLSEASGYQLLVVCGACWGSAVMAAMGAGERPAAFSAAIGFRTEVTEGRLFDAMVELYRSLRRGESLEESVASAQRELVADQQLELRMAVLVAAQIVVGAFRRLLPVVRNAPRERAQRIQIARRAWDTWFSPALQEQQPAYRFENVLPMLQI